MTSVKWLKKVITGFRQKNHWAHCKKKHIEKNPLEIDDSVPEACKDNKKKIKDTMKRCGMKLGKKKPSGGKKNNSKNNQNNKGGKKN